MTVVQSDIATLTDYAQAVLDAAENALATTYAGVPDHVFLDAGEPAFDCCPFLSVHVAGLTEEPTSPQSAAMSTALRTTVGSVIRATYAITATRCAAVPDNNGNPPTDAEKAAVAVMVQQDGWALWNELRHAVADGDLFETCTGVHFEGGRPIQSQGGCVGWRFVVSAHVPGIPNNGTT